MTDSKKTFMFIYGNMYVGGIELYLIRLIRKLKANGNRIIWLAPADNLIDETLKPDLMDGYIERIDVRLYDLNQINRVSIVFGEKEEIVALALNLITFMQLEVLKKKYKTTRIDSFYWVSHFKGLFLEDLLIKPLQPVARKYMGKIIYTMEQNDNIIYGKKTHLEAFTRRYKYKVDNEEKKFFKSTKEIKPYNDRVTLKRSTRSEFNIITVGRFDFPHKAYLLGLIRVYGELKVKYEHLKLTIIGYGKDENKVRDEIEKLSPIAKKDANLVGKVSYDNLRGYFENAHLNIGVAGTISDGALTGLISIPVRHYSETCEGYGYLPESKWKILSIEPGIPIESFIEEVISMSQEKYLDLSRKAYDTYADDSAGTILSILDCQNRDPRKTLPYRVINVFKLYRVIRNIKKSICNHNL